jgi:hypothetical protein
MMGMFDTYLSRDGKYSIQLKVGPCALSNYVEGGPPGEEVEDGAYFSFEGVVVIRNGKVVYVGPEDGADVDGIKHYTKWGDDFDTETDQLDNYHPLKPLIQKLEGET